VIETKGVSRYAIATQATPFSAQRPRRLVSMVLPTRIRPARS
jgi:hypothetical protein